ncbi:MAG TPA: DUF3810 domain-containing protein [Clostridiales bacterium UBA8960]|nr:DUF3810 domain-containing protein [Clostridiales bacterium UBA8960]
MDGVKLFKSLIPLILVPIVYAIATNIPNVRESYEIYYAASINKWMNGLLSLLTGTIKYSLGEFILYAHVAAVPIVAVVLIVKLLKGGILKSLFRLVQYISILYILFMLLWGFNYERQSVSVEMGFEVRPYSKEELTALTTHLIDEANRLRLYQLEDAEGVMMMNGTYREVIARAHKGYDQIGTSIKSLRGIYGRPKAILASELMLYTGITGVYFPFTAEANINVAIPDMMLPATTLHEMAHQRGIAPEDEANFIAYVTAMAHPDKDFNYSGTVLALIHSMNALFRKDADLAMSLRETYSEGLNRDMSYYASFWASYEGKTNEVADKVNDTYLKANRQEDGVQSYGRMVDLLLGYFLAQKN